MSEKCYSTIPTLKRVTQQEVGGVLVQNIFIYHARGGGGCVTSSSAKLGIFCKGMGGGGGILQVK